MINTSIANLLPHAQQLFASHKVKNAYIFGSAITDKFTDLSDLDFEINFQDGLEPLEKGDLWWDLYEKLREKFQRER